jgi:Protein of unknown function (DUF3999)
MKKQRLIALLLFAAVSLTIVMSAFAQAAAGAWPFYVELNTGSATPGLYDLIVPFHIMDKSRNDLADLRIYDGIGREIPYALRVRSEIDDSKIITANIFNRSFIGNSHEVSVDLGEDHGQHNAVEILTSGSNFRRKVMIEGGDSGTDWRTLKTGDIIFGFHAQNKLVDSNRVNYSPSRFRYLRIRVMADELSDAGDRPYVNDVRVLMAVREKGEVVRWAVNVPSYQLLRNQGAPASAWSIDLGARVPVDRLELDFEDPSFSRPFQLEAIDGQDVRLVAAGELTRRAGDDKPVMINFDHEEHTRNLRLLVTDYSNQTLSITSIQPGAAARQLVFELSEPASQPLRLFFGNQNVSAPHYDFEKEFSTTKLSSPPARISVSGTTPNPNYTPEPLPFTERVPWLIYLVLAASSIALALILISLARRSLRRVNESSKVPPTEERASESH